VAARRARMAASGATAAPTTSEFEFAHRQAVVDETWERKLADEQHRREQAERRSFHKAPGDPDWN